MESEKENKKYEKELFDLCESDSNTKAIMAKYNLDRNDLENSYTQLAATGGEKREKGIYTSSGDA